MPVKINKKIVFDMIFLILILFFSFDVFSQGLVFEIRSSKNEYLLYEPIWVELILRNESDKPIVVECFKYTCPDLIKFVVRERLTGKVFEYTGPWYHRISNPIDTIMPGDYIWFYYILTPSNYGEHPCGEKLFKDESIAFLPAGEYEVFSDYTPVSYILLERGYKMIKLTSNRINFRIRKPEGGREYEAFKLMEKLILMSCEAFKTGKYTGPSEEDIYRTLVENYSDLPYAEYAYNYLDLYVSDHDKFRKEGIMKFPDSYYVEEWLNTLFNFYEYKGRLDEFDRFASEVLAKFPDSRAGKCIKKLMKRRR